RSPLSKGRTDLMFPACSLTISTMNGCLVRRFGNVLTGRSQLALSRLGAFRKTSAPDVALFRMQSIRTILLPRKQPGRASLRGRLFFYRLELQRARGIAT